MTEDFLVFKEISLSNGVTYYDAKLDNQTYAPSGFLALRAQPHGNLVLVNVRHIVECEIAAEAEKNLGLFDWYPEVIQST